MIRHGHEVRRVLWTALLLNIIVAIAKTAYGLATGTLSVLADGLHSFTDAGSSVMGLVAVRVADRPLDKGHHYGHEKYETLAALGIAAFIGLTSWEILKSSIHRLWIPHHPTYNTAGFWIMGATIAVNASLSYYERKKGKDYESTILEADAYHTFSDIWVSISVLVSLVAVKYEVVWIDSIVSLVIAIYFAFIAYRIARTNVLVLSDAAFLDKQKIRGLVQSVPGILSCHRIRTRGRPGSAFIDLHVQIDPESTTMDAHEIVHQVEQRIQSEIEGVRDVLIHSEPYPDDDLTIP